MNPSDMAEVLARVTIYDGRTLGMTDVAAWHAAAGHLDFDDALAAVVRYYAAETDRMMPAHLIREVQAIRNDRAAKQQHQIRELPSRFELDDARDERIKRHLPALMAKWSIGGNDPGDPHAAALAMARRERRGRPAQLPRPRREPGKPIDLSKVTTGPDWASPEARERESIIALHKAGQPCGKRACSRDTCKRVEADVP